jgi:medium-chain acyl-[acyl-carrier-protein] hydrolase
MNELVHWTGQYRINVYETDHKGKASLTALCDYFQNSASDHYYAGVRKGGHGLKDSQLWMLSRIRLAIDRYPQWHDDVTLKTWSRGNDRLFMLRDFTVSSSAGEVLARGTSSWLIVDISTRKIVRPDGFAGQWPYHADEAALNANADRIEGARTPDFGDPFHVRYSDIDVNGHVNNVRYIQWVLDGYDLAFHEAYEPAFFEINFMDEVMIGQEIVLGMGKASGAGSGASAEYLHTGVRKSDNKEFCRARVIWRQRTG